MPRSRMGIFYIRKKERMKVRMKKQKRKNETKKGGEESEGEWKEKKKGRRRERNEGRKEEKKRTKKHLEFLNFSLDRSRSSCTCCHSRQGVPGVQRQLVYNIGSAQPTHTPPEHDLIRGVA